MLAELRSTCARAIALAGILPGQQTIVSCSRAWELPADPLRRFSELAGCQRSLLWHGNTWLLAVGISFEAAADGPGRFYHLAETVSSLQSRAVQYGDELLFLIRAGFEDRPPGPSHWGRHLAGAVVTLPRRLYQRHADGSGQRLDTMLVGPDDSVDDLLQRLLDQAPEDLAPAPRRAWPALNSERFEDLVVEAIEQLQLGSMRKVVLARAVDHRLSERPELAAVLQHLRRHADERTYVYAQDLDADSCFIGATPELLFHSRGERCLALSLAGSRPRDTDPARDRQLADELLSSTKERKEHQLVVEHVVAQLKPRCTQLLVPETPSIRRLSRLQHLETLITGSLDHPDPFDVLAALQPTPAVAGLPSAAACAWIRRHEGLHRGLYAGSLGTVSGDEAHFVVPLRGGIIRDHDARLFAGAGIVETSQPVAETEETELKLRPMRQALGVG